MQKNLERSGSQMMIKKLIEEKKKDKDFAEAYDREGRKLETAVALYHAREEAGLTQAELAQKHIQLNLLLLELREGITYLSINLMISPGH